MSKIDKHLCSIEEEFDRLERKLDMALYSIVIAILVPIAIRIFFP